MAKNIDAAREDQVRDDFELLYRRLTTGDLAAAHDLLAPDAVLRVPGRSQISGNYHGPEAIAGFFETLNDLSENTAKVSVVDVTEAEGRAVVLQEVVARRGGRKLEDEQNVVLRVHTRRVTEMLLYPHDIRAHDVFWGRAPLLTPEDRDLLAAAIKAGSAPPPDPNAKKRVVAWFVVAVGVFLVSIIIFSWLNSTYSRQQLTATTTDLSGVDSLVIADDNDKGRWILGGTMATDVTVLEQLGEVRVTLPIAQSRCDELASSLRSVCTGGVIPVDPQFSFSWPQPARVTGSAGKLSRLDVGLDVREEEQSISQMSLVTTSLKSPSLCFNEPSERTRVTLIDGDGRQATTPVAPKLPPLTCGNGVVLSIGDGRRQDHATGVVFDGVSSAELDAFSKSVEIDGLAGRLALVNVERHVFDDAAHVITNASSEEPIHTELDTGGVENRLTMTSDEATSVLTDDGEVLPTQWERLPQPLVALIGSLATALVLPALIAFLQMGRDRLLLGRRQPQ
jgi:uncharacterized protein